MYSPQVMVMSYTDFREKISILLDEYDEYRIQPNTASRIELEDSIDDLFIYLRKESDEQSPIQPKPN